MTDALDALAQQHGAVAVGATSSVAGLLTPGTVDLAHRPRVTNADGSISTVRSISFNDGGKEVLIPTVVGGQVVSDDEAIKAYRASGEHLGIFDTPAHATAYAQQLHQDQAKTLDAAGPADPLDALAQAHGAVQPDFTSTAVQPSLFDLGTELVKGFGAQLNPLPLLKAMYDRTAEEFNAALTAGREGRYAAAAAHAGAMPTAPAAATVSGLADAHLEQFKKAYHAFQEGRLSEALGHTLAGVVPIVGPAAATVGEEIGTGDPMKMAHGVGGALALVAPAALKYGTEVARTGSAFPTTEAVAEAPPLTRTIAPLANANPAERAAVEFGDRRGIPVDLATASGNPVVRGAQKVAEHTSLAGSYIGRQAGQVQGDAFARVGNDLASEAYPHPVTAETAGADVRTSIGKLIGDLHAQATDAYERLRSMEADPAHAAEVPRDAVDPAAAAAVDATKLAKMSESLGYVPKIGEMAELRRIKAELDSLPFVKRTWNDVSGDVGKRGNAAGGDAQIVKGAAGAPVYDDIMQMTNRNGDLLVPSEMTRGEVRASLDKALTTGQFTNAAKAALEVARGRLRGDRGLSRPSLPPSAGDIAPSTTTMLMPVDIRPAKAALSAMHEQLKSEAEFAQKTMVPMSRAKATAYRAVDGLVNGPDFGPVSVVDAALGDLKAMARGAELPALRSDAQGVAAQAVKHLDAVVRQAVERAGPEAVSALEEGRNATVAKYASAAVLDKLREEPVQVFRQAIASKDAAISHLRAVAELAPAETQKIGRAFLEDLLQQATADGAFDKAKGLAAKWDNLGPQTRTLLFGTDLTSELNHFFLLAKRAAENPNPSGSAYVGGLIAHGYLFRDPVSGVGYELGAGALAKAMRSPAIVKALTKGMTVQVRNFPAAVTAFGQLMKTAGSDAVRVPAAARSLTPGKEPAREPAKALDANTPASTTSAKPDPETHEFASTQVNLPPTVSAKVIALAHAIPDKDLADDGREDRPHVTVKFGLHGNDPDAVRALLAGEPPIRLKLGVTSVFPANESGTADVVKADVVSADLRRLNKKIAGALEHTETHPDYKPHATIAYVKPGLGKKYAGNPALLGQEITIDRIVFSDKHRREIEIPLGGALRQRIPDRSRQPPQAGVEEAQDRQTGDERHVPLQGARRGDQRRRLRDEA